MVGDILQPTHLLFVLVVALLVLGPKRLPEAARTLGNGLRDFRSALSGDHNDEPRSYLPPDKDSPPAPTVQPVPASAMDVEHTEDPADAEHTVEPAAVEHTVEPAAVEHPVEPAAVVDTPPTPATESPQAPSGPPPASGPPAAATPAPAPPTSSAPRTEADPADTGDSPLPAEPAPERTA